MTLRHGQDVGHVKYRAGKKEQLLGQLYVPCASSMVPPTPTTTPRTNMQLFDLLLTVHLEKAPTGWRGKLHLFSCSLSFCV